MNGISNVELEDNMNITSKGNGNNEARAGAIKSDSSRDNIPSQLGTAVTRGALWLPATVA